jgi:hypothetical protein
MVVILSMSLSILEATSANLRVGLSVLWGASSMSTVDMIVRVLEGAFEVEEVVSGIEVGWRQVIGRIRMRLQKSARLYALGVHQCPGSYHPLQILLFKVVNIGMEEQRIETARLLGESGGRERQSPFLGRSTLYFASTGVDDCGEGVPSLGVASHETLSTSSLTSMPQR